MIVGTEVRTVRSGNTLLAPPGTPYKLINNTWVPARLLMIFPSTQLEKKLLE
jgi:quercetin dioxygenase-like cupin family protein